MSDRRLADFRWLLEHADEELGRAGREDRLQLLHFFRARHSTERAAMLVELRELRQRGTAKFSQAHRMFFTRRGLEQATDERIAAYKAERFPPGAPVADLCCGIGGDATALAARRPLTIVDNDPVMPRIAQANILVHQASANVDQRCTDARDMNWGAYPTWHVDPDRRPGGQRRSDPSRYGLSATEILQLSAQHPHGAVKMAPAADTREFARADIELQWLGHQRQCQQLVAWLGSLARAPGKRVATWLWQDSEGQARASDLVQDDAPAPECAGGVGRMLYEPRPPVLAAHLQDTLAARHDLRPISPGIPYYTTDRWIDREPLLVGFEVLETLPLRVKTLRKRLAQLDASVVEVKKRGINIDPRLLLEKLRMPGRLPITLVCTRIGKSIRGLLTRRCPSI